MTRLRRPLAVQATGWSLGQRCFLEFPVVAFHDELPFHFALYGAIPRGHLDRNGGVLPDTLGLAAGSKDNAACFLSSAFAGIVAKRPFA